MSAEGQHLLFTQRCVPFAFLPWLPAWLESLDLPT